MRVRIAGILESSVCDGPGIRMVVFFQGCQHKCFGCHNQSTWELEGGSEWELSDLIQYIKNNCLNKKITLSGGDPLLQKKQVYYLSKELKKDGYNILLYTGYLAADVPSQILKYIDYIIDGSYINDLKDATLPFRGSRNQKFIKVERMEDEICLIEI